ncbi:hypothetical protein ACFV0C_36910 [Streptomyces sp. NPDC059568]|uniref:hypothetical protein n=1 Tax=Streptomyces sp. NPDC059568 TaxID=3346868 RepID=UPI0036A58D08
MDSLPIQPEPTDPSAPAPDPNNLFAALKAKADEIQDERRAHERSETLTEAANVLARLVALGANDPFTLIARLFLMADSTPPTEQPTGRCGNDPRTVLSAEDRATVRAFQAYLTAKNSPEAGEQR